MHKQNNCVLHQCSASHQKSVLRVRQCFANIKKNCASHDCSASHHCCLVSSLFEIRHAKHRWFTHAKKNFPSHITHPPFKLASSGDVQNRKLKTVPPATQISLGKSCTMQVKKKKRLFGFGCSMRHAKS